MLNSGIIQTIYEDSLRANLYTINHFRMIGLIDVLIAFKMHPERVTLAYYSSSGTNNGKIKGLWYPIIGIKLHNGAFTEFTPALNYILTQTTRHQSAHSGWLAKSLFFSFPLTRTDMLNGFAGDPYYEKLFEIGRCLQALYETGDFIHLANLNGALLNNILTSDRIYPGNQRSQSENFEEFITEIFAASKKKAYK